MIKKSALQKMSTLQRYQYSCEITGYGEPHYEDSDDEDPQVPVDGYIWNNTTD